MLRFLSFEIASESFGIDLERVKEVIAFPDFTSSPGSPNYVLGLMSLRENVIPLVDLRIRLGIEPTLTLDTAVIVCEVNTRIVGLVVDIIYTVVTPQPSDVLAVPDLSDSKNEQFVSNVVRNAKALTLILNINKIVGASEEELANLRDMTEKLRTPA